MKVFRIITEFRGLRVRLTPLKILNYADYNILSLSVYLKYNVRSSQCRGLICDCGIFRSSSMTFSNVMNSSLSSSVINYITLPYISSVLIQSIKNISDYDQEKPHLHIIAYLFYLQT